MKKIEKSAVNKEIIIAKIKGRKSVLKNRGIKRIGLFGSYLKGTQKRGSDIDLLIQMKDINADDYFGLWTYFENLFGRKVDLIIESDLRKELGYVKKEATYVEI